MSDEDAFYLAIEQRPDDGLPRKVFADWLEEQAGTEAAPCETCRKKDDEVNHPAGMMFVGWGHGWQPCSACGGSGVAGYVPDRAARRSTGYRALGEYGRAAHHYSASRSFGWNLLGVGRSINDGRDDLPEVWFKNLPPSDRAFDSGTIKTWHTRRGAEDAAALAWSAMTDDERERCHRELTEPVKS